jgi:NAD(P) transhydrogenase subunit alpha
VKIGIPKEIAQGERRVAATPASVKRLRAEGHSVLVQSGAGDGAGISDAAFAEAGATLVPTQEALFAEAELICAVRPPDFLDQEKHQIDLVREGAVWVGFIWPAQHEDLLRRMGERKLTVLALDAVPRITRAQRMDALSAMANLAGYRAVIEAAHHFGRSFNGQMTAAGKIAPAKVLVVGAGVAGLSAIGTAKSLGAQVRAFDTRPPVREQVESMGATFVPFDFQESGEGEGGYARRVSDAYLAAEQALLAQHAKEVDVIITTALIPGMAAPKLVTSGAVVSMHPGSVIVDLAAEQGGNCALTQPDEVVTKFGVTIVGHTNLTSRMAPQASELYATVITRFLEAVCKEGKLALDLDDEIHRGALVLQEGQLMWPPPKPVQRAGAPRPQVRPAPPPSPAPPRTLTKVLLGVLALGLLVVCGFAPPSFLRHFTVFVLACVVGWHVVWNVTPALHTPLMSVTNAISGIILVGGILLLGGGSTVAVVLASAAILVASINVTGGFLVSQRMLRMFRR